MQFRDSLMLYLTFVDKRMYYSDVERIVVQEVLEDGNRP